MIRKIRDAIEANHLLDHEEKVVVAVSGGPDSIALLKVLEMLSHEYRLTLIVAHLNHGLREDAPSEERFVRKMAQDMGLLFESKSLDVASLRKVSGKCMEDTSREARYDFLNDVAKKHGARKIALGHHMNDQTETVLMNFLRGSGPSGLKGMLTSRDSRYIRPLLAATRDEITSFLASHGLPFVTDASNADQRYLRNRIRHALVPELKARYNPNLDEGIRSMAEIMRVENEYMKMATDKVLLAWGITSGDSEFRIRISDFLEYHEAIQRRIMKHLLEWLSPHGKGIGFRHINAALELIRSDRPGAYVNLPCDIEVRREYGVLVISKKEVCDKGILNKRCDDLYYEVTPPASVKMPKLGKTMIFKFAKDPIDVKANTRDAVLMDYDRISPPLVIRTVRPGDKIQPLGMRGMKKIKSVLIDEKIPRRHRREIPLLLDQDAVLWIAGLRLSERVKITEKTRQILEVEFV
ncbi:MAG: tRNA lysidine(34) synthetase TilS [Syntrophales bacterium]